MSEPQLERSVLEAKERDELLAIADALGTKPASRAKKADLIAQILRATGVEVSTAADADQAGSDRPRRTRAKKATGPATAQESPDAAEQSVGNGAGPATVGGGDSAGEAAAGARAASRARAGAARSTGAARTSPPAATGAPDTDPAGQPGPPPDTTGDHDATRDPGADTGGPAKEPGASYTIGSGDSPGAGSMVPGGVVDAGADDHAAAGPEPSAVAGGATSNGSASTAGNRGGPSFDADRARPDTPPGPDTPEGHEQSHPGAPQQPGQHGFSTASQSPGDRARLDGEPGNRRNRRRRGRDRGDRVERDIQSQPGEQAYSGEPIEVKGYLDLREEGFGFLRTKGYIAGPEDVYASISQVRRFGLRKGDEIEGACRPAASNEKYPALLRIDTISGLTPEEARLRPKFEDLTPLFPDEKLRLEVPGDPANLTARIVDLISPIGKGQRGLIVSPPKAGKTTVLKQIAHSIEANNPEIFLMVLLVDERPEEVTDMRRSVKGEVIASTFDRPSEEHTQVAELTIERAKRLVELGKDVVIVLDGITRLARAYNLAQPATGRIMSGGIDTGALYPPKKFFGSARNIEEGGSLTILATALVETGSRMDEVIFEEFKGTGNMELRLDRRLAERRIYPALDVNASSTRHEELLFDRQQLQQVWKLRRVLNALGSEGSDAAGLQLLMDKIKSTKSNDEFLAEIAKTPAPAI